LFSKGGKRESQCNALETERTSPWHLYIEADRKKEDSLKLVKLGEGGPRAVASGGKGELLMGSLDLVRKRSPSFRWPKGGSAHQKSSGPQETGPSGRKRYLMRNIVIDSGNKESTLGKKEAQENT